jgi:hypothetical protein
MSATRKLALASAVMMLVLSNLFLLVGAMLNEVDWTTQLLRAAAAGNLVYVVPALLAAALAAVPVARDPDFLETPPAFAAAAVLLLSFVAYFLLALGWFPLMKGIGMVPSRMQTAAPVILFMTMLAMACLTIPAWWLESRIVRRVQARARAGANGGAA